MTLSNLNQNLFLYINSSNESSAFLHQFGIFIAQDLLHIFFILFALLWLWGDNITKKYIAKVIIFTMIGGCISQLISHFFHMPRPFVLGIGHNILPHAPTGSFPSNHMFIFSSIAFSYLFSPYKQYGITLLFIALLVGWSRVFVGVHFPLDILGGFIIAFLVNYLGLGVWNKYQDKLMIIILKIYHALFKPLINKGWIK